MGLSVASLNPIKSVTYVSQKPQAYTIENKSDVSSAYKESLKNTVTPEGINGPAPVQYATRFNRVSSTSLDKNRLMNRAYNTIASAFGGDVTGYDRNREPSAYGVVGNGVDLFA